MSFWKIVLSAVLVIFLSPYQTAKAQEPSNLGGWTMYWGTHQLSNPKWVVYTEVQFRQRHISQQREQILIRMGVGRKINKHWTLGGGGAAITSYTENADWHQPATLENRLFLQEIRVDQWKGLRFENRFRQEYRNLPNVEPFRFRHRLLVSIPLSVMGLKTERWKLHFYDEYFLQPGVNWFDRNRLYGALGFKMAHAEVQVGYLIQTVGNGGYSGQYLQLGLLVF